MPPVVKYDGLLAADTDIRSAIGRLVGAPLSDDDWRLASLGISSGGIGARSACEHVPAAYVGSFPACRDLCAAIWPAFDPLDLDEGWSLAADESALSASIPSGTSVYAESDTPSQKSLSAKIEEHAVSKLLQDPALARARRLHFDACRAPGFGAWLMATPASRDLHIPSPVFRVAMQRRLRMPIWECDTACGLCGEVLDRWGDHALCCCGGGDRVLWHNAIRNVVGAAFSEFTSITPEFEKPGLLLPPKAPDPGGPDSGFIHLPGGGRRPADIWVPRGSSNLAEAWDFSISSLLRTSFFSSASPFEAGVFHEVESRKNSFQNTASQVAALDATFRPLVLEACGGGWSPALREVIAWVSTESRALRGSVGNTPRDVSLRIAQRISCTLQRENARAVIRRALEVVDGFSGLAGDQVSGTGW